ncbi:MAG TPA: diaminopimelate epimerase [Acidimicrobiales bacterium]|nr:diaminopimelate epimerase [Acidimicrobiales bacterium]
MTSAEDNTAADGNAGAVGTRRELALAKYEGLGNDFLVLVDLEGRLQIDAPLARFACDRHLGLGADGLLRGGPPQQGSSDAMTFELRNADGGEAEMSGNGLRCLVHAAIDSGAVNAGPGTTLGVLTPAGHREVLVHSLEDGWMWASTEMGEPKVLGPADNCNVGNGQLFVDVGNPHLVVLGPDPRTVDVASLGPALSDETGAQGGVNVEFVALGPGRDELTMRVWERGVGETQACGTGSVAAAAALHHWGRVGTKVTVNQPGGAAEVELRVDGTAVLTGPSRRVATCRLLLAAFGRVGVEQRQ